MAPGVRQSTRWLTAQLLGTMQTHPQQESRLASCRSLLPQAAPLHRPALWPLLALLVEQPHAGCLPPAPGALACVARELALQPRRLWLAAGREESAALLGLARGRPVQRQMALVA